MYISQWSPKFYNNIFLLFGSTFLVSFTEFWLLRWEGWVSKRFNHCIVIYSRGNFVYHNFLCISIYRQLLGNLSHPQVLEIVERLLCKYDESRYFVFFSWSKPFFQSKPGHINILWLFVMITQYKKSGHTYKEKIV